MLPCQNCSTNYDLTEFRRQVHPKQHLCVDGVGWTKKFFHTRVAKSRFRLGDDGFRATENSCVEWNSVDVFQLSGHRKLKQIKLVVTVRKCVVLTYTVMLYDTWLSRTWFRVRPPSQSIIYFCCEDALRVQSQPVLACVVCVWLGFKRRKACVVDWRHWSVIWPVVCFKMIRDVQVTNNRYWLDICPSHITI